MKIKRRLLKKWHNYFEKENFKEGEPTNYEETVNLGFGIGAKWADNNPSEESIKKIAKLTHEYVHLPKFDGQSMIEYIKTHFHDNESDGTK